MAGVRRVGLLGGGRIGPNGPAGIWTGPSGIDCWATEIWTRRLGRIGPDWTAASGLNRTATAGLEFGLGWAAGRARVGRLDYTGWAESSRGSMRIVNHRDRDGPPRAVTCEVARARTQER
ncbi:hypothetical protein CRG98_009439 [Punica granatum]|uniref:Uncharacterized protein n=1 Tax=Punica granatum TaxID=22663 RepID=A0A2I0KP20_PUNGR|nr:hypothetical protein CRG98_009439 [Punica granatum]